MLKVSLSAPLKILVTHMVSHAWQSYRYTKNKRLSEGEGREKKKLQDVSYFSSLIYGIALQFSETILHSVGNLQLRANGENCGIKSYRNVHISRRQAG